MEYERFTPSGCKDIGIRKYEFDAKTQLLSRSDVQNCYFGDFQVCFIEITFLIKMKTHCGKNRFLGVNSYKDAKIKTDRYVNDVRCKNEKSV